jgi:hypothetical protein
MKNNDVFNVLVSNANLSLLPTGNPIGSLAVGQFGVFNEGNNISIDSTATFKNLFFALGLDEDGDAVTDSVNKSAGQYIQHKNILKYTYKPYSAGQNFKAKIYDYKAMCDTLYGVRIVFQNEEIFKSTGSTQFSKSYITKTSCCGDSCLCPKGDANEITLGLYAQMSDEELFTVVMKASQNLTVAVHNTSVNYATGATMIKSDVEALITFNSLQTEEALKVWTYLELESTPQAIKNFLGINTQYYKLRGTSFEVSTIFVAGMGCSGKTAVLQDIKFEQGLGYDVNELEYEAAGWGDNGPYRLNSITGLTKETLKYVATPAVHYDLFVLEYEYEAQAGRQNNKNDLTTIFAIPSANTTTINSLKAFLDVLTA